MERLERVKRYKNGESISFIAKEANVSRQAIIDCLKKAGVHKQGKGGRPKLKRLFNNPVVVIKKQSKDLMLSNCPIDSIPEIDLTKQGITIKRIGRNLYVSNKGFTVKYFIDGKMHEYNYKTREEVLNAYNL